MTGQMIFFTGSPGSRWSTLAKVLGGLPLFDTSDASEARTYQHHRFGGHSGSYFGPGMEFGRDFDRLDRLGREEIVRELARPFAAPGAGSFRLLKSHVFAHHLDFLRHTFPTAGIIVVWRDADACLDWWLKIGGFSIPYPDYSWYGDEKTMAREIRTANEAIEKFVERRGLELVPMSPEWIWQVMGIRPPEFTEEYFSDVMVAADFRIEHAPVLVHPVPPDA